MARSSGLRTVIKVAKAIDRASKQAERERIRRIKAIEREEKAQIRRAAQAERERLRAERERVRAEARALKDEAQYAKECFEDRAEDRRLAKEDIINEYVR
ncbi:hypothetical protein ACJJJB_08120 [Microbulbifer sp. ANSA001]|uniref:hypothetical protein n=1 Tax=Microbulbifer sp. ANSA001 TaxID=3243358 RepID=UPI0040415676